MAQTIRIEIPITAKDNTGGAVKAVEQKLNSLEKSYQKMQKQLQKLSGKRFEIDLDANDHATDKIADAEAAVSHMDGHSANVDVTADDQATDIINDVQGALSSADGDAANLEIDADDAATTVIEDADDALADVDGDTASLYVEADDAASPVIDEVEEKANSLNGSICQLTISAIDLATTPITGILNLLRNPIFSLMSTLGLGFGIGDSINTYNGIEAQLSQVQAISGASGEEMGRLSQQARDLGASTKFTAQEVAEGYSYMGMAGWTASQMMAGIPAILSLSAASGESLGTTSDIVTDALTAFGLQAEDTAHFSDVLAQASASANTDVGKMGESFKYVAPIAGAMGYSIEDTALALSAMAASGVKSSMAGTSLRRAITNLAAPTDKVATAMEKYGISLDDGAGNAKSLIDVLGNARESLGGLGKIEKEAAASTIFGTQASAAMLSIINMSDDAWQDLTEAIYNADGAAEEMAATMLDNTVGSLTIMQSALSAVKDNLGERLSPYVRAFAEGMTEWLPTASGAIDNFMDVVDQKVSNASAPMREMMRSQEWTEADLFGKVDIAWNKMVADPFTKWAGGSGKNLMTKGLSRLFGEAAKIAPGGEEAGLTSWLSAGIIAKGAAESAKGIMSMASAVGSLSPALGTAIPFVAAAAAGIGAITVAVENYKLAQKEANLDAHFGEVSLSTAQIEQVAGQIVDVEFTANMKAANVQFDNAAGLVSQAEQLLAQNNFLWWKIDSVGIESGAGADIISNSEEFTSKLLQAIEGDEYAVSLTITTLLGSANAEPIVSQLQQWFAEDSAAIEGMGAAVSDMLSRAFEEGADTVNLSTAATILQNKMLEMVNGQHMAELEGQLKWLMMSSLGGAMDAESFKGIADASSQLVEEQVNETSAAYQRTIGKIEGLVGNDPARQALATVMEDTLNTAFADYRNTASGKVFDSLFGGLQQAYGQELSSMGGVMQGSDFMSYLLGIDGSGMGVAGAFSVLQSDIEKGFKGMEPGTQAALSELYGSMSGSVDQMDKVISDAAANGKAVPEALMQSYRQAMMLAAASDPSNEGAMWQYMANEMAQQFPDKSSFISALEQNGVHFDEWPSAVQTAFDKAFVETTANGGDYDMASSLLTAFSGDNVDWSAVEGILNQYGYSIAEELASQGIDVSGAEIPADMSGAEVVPEGEPDVDTAQSEFQDALDGAFDETFEENPEVDIEADQTNNADEVYSEAEADIQSRFGQAIEAHGSVNITLDWHITNPTASISVGVSGGSATATIASAGFATGGYIGDKILSWLGEEGPEYVIPTTGRYKGNGEELWLQAGEDLGMFDNIQGHASGGYIDGGKSSDSNIWSSLGSGGTQPVSKESGGSVSVGAPKINAPITINGSGMNAQEIVNAVRENLSDIADDLAGNMAKNLSQIFGNMPLTQEA